MDKDYFYRYQNLIFVFPEQLPTTEKLQKKVCVFRNKEDAKNLQKIQSTCDATGVLSSNPETIAFWINKKIDYIINPFDFRGKGFDKNTFSILIQNKIYPIIILEKIILQNSEQQLQLFKHLFSFNKLCQKYKLPLIILCEDPRVCIALYYILGYNETQAQSFLKQIFDEMNL
ncbi:MAG: hypothetical protein COT14_00885 [Candidatus Diapherotrites archaeon CG08_land_8_20_14_0_20_30_16]|nr:MAG: hypothetical protein COT14_00885 [Candidatus Diapherotrites archaeon CG08_land_8_20_14_0_20_30_16]